MACSSPRGLRAAIHALAGSRVRLGVMAAMVPVGNRCAGGDESVSMTCSEALSAAAVGGCDEPSATGEAVLRTALASAARSDVLGRGGLSGAGAIGGMAAPHGLALLTRSCAHHAYAVQDRVGQRRLAAQPSVPNQRRQLANDNGRPAVHMVIQPSRSLRSCAATHQGVASSAIGELFSRARRGSQCSARPGHPLVIAPVDLALHRQRPRGMELQIGYRVHGSRIMQCGHLPSPVYLVAGRAHDVAQVLTGSGRGARGWHTLMHANAVPKRRLAFGDVVCLTHTARTRVAAASWRQVLSIRRMLPPAFESGRSSEGTEKLLFPQGYPIKSSRSIASSERYAAESFGPLLAHQNKRPPVR